MTRVAAGFSSSGRLRLPPEENPKGSHHLAGSNTKNAQLIIAIDHLYKDIKISYKIINLIADFAITGIINYYFFFLSDLPVCVDFDLSLLLAISILSSSSS